jgi:hypothetical protein
MNRILHYPAKLISKLFKLYSEGLSKTIIIVIVVFLISTLEGAGRTGIERFVPIEYQFPEMGIVFIFVVLPLFMVLLKYTGIFKIFPLLLRKIPLLKFFFREKGNQEGIPVIAKDGNGLVYGLLRGRSIIYDDTGFVENGKIWWSVFIPSSPVPVTSMMPKDFAPENVREIELVRQPGRGFAQTAIISKCVNLGESLGDIVLKRIKEEEVAQMPVLSEKEKEEIAKSYKKALT